MADISCERYKVNREFQLCSIQQLGYDRNGYSFFRWKDESGNLLSDAQKTKFIETEKHISAIWNPIEYGITYNLDGGTHSGNPSKYTIEDSITFNKPTKTGYNAGEFTPASIPQGTTGNLTVVASYSNPITYNISYELDGGVNGNNPTSYTIESETSVLQPATKFQHTFDKWTENGNQITAIQKGSYGNKTLSANYIRSNVTVRYHANWTV